MTQVQIEKLAQISADVACFRDFAPEITQHVKALEQETRATLEELRQKVETQAAQIEALQKPD